MFIRDDPKILQQRLAAYVRPYPAKVLARKGGCSEDTAEKWREGVSWPSARHWLHLISAFGRDLTECVFHPDAAAARLEQEVADLEAKLSERRAALGLVAESSRSFASRSPQAAPRHEDRTAAVTVRTD